jgi:hypothetical protein
MTDNHDSIGTSGSCDGRDENQDICRTRKAGGLPRVREACLGKMEAKMEANQEKI